MTKEFFIKGVKYSGQGLSARPSPAVNDECPSCASFLALLPLTWNAQELTFRGQTYPAKSHAPILVFPNPLNPHRYIVLNSGITFRSESFGTNALQVPKLPDWAIVDLRTPPGPRWPGRIVDAGFFDEEWK